MAKASNKKTDAALFAGLNPTPDTPIQKVVPVKESEVEIEQVLFQVPLSYKKKIKRYITDKDDIKSIKDFFIKAGEEYMANHPSGSL